jgi:cell division protein FtsW
VITWLLGQAIINISMVSGLLPVIGVPLPFISYGGSAMVSSLAGIGMILAVTRVRPAPDMPVKGPTGKADPARTPPSRKPRTRFRAGSIQPRARVRGP